MSGKIPRAFIDEVLARTSLVDFINSYVPLTKKGKNYLACCPFHQEKSPSFNVIADKQFYYCFGCGASGNAISFAMEYLKKDFVTAIEELAALTGLHLPRESGSAEKFNQIKKAYGFLDEVSQAYYGIALNTPNALAYLKQRKISKKTAEHFQIGFVPDDWHFLSKKFPNQQKLLLETGMLVKNDQGKIYDRYRNRLMFPIRDKRGRVIGFGGRVIEPEQKPKYLNSPETQYFKKSQELYGLYHVQQNKPENILIVEGYMDVVALFEHGVQNAVATLGTATTGQHLNALFKASKHLIFCFDGDEAGYKAATRALHTAIPLIIDDMIIQFMFLPAGEDPDSYIQTNGKAAFQTQMQQALPLNEFFFQGLKRQTGGINNVQGRSKLVALAKPTLTTMPDNAMKVLLIKQLALLTHIDEPQLRRIIEGSQQLSIPQLVMRKQNRPQPSAMRVAIAIFIQQPALFNTIKDEINLELLAKTENKILTEILPVLSKCSSTAQILELWRDKSDYPVIAKLAAYPLNIPQEGFKAELMGALKQIEKNTLQSHIDRLLYKASVESLTQDDKKQLQGMIKRQKLLVK